VRARLPEGLTLAVMVRDAEPPSQERVRGAALGLPAEGPGSLASFGTRILAFFVDAFASAIVAGIFTAPHLPANWSLVAFAAITVVTLVAFGQTPGMRLFGLRLAHPQEGRRLASWRAVVRTALLMLLLPALLVDADGRGLHDRLTDTAVIRG
jgi:uncharacterized RDD family membrane protein YckC